MIPIIVAPVIKVHNQNRQPQIGPTCDLIAKVVLAVNIWSFLLVLLDMEDILA